MAERTLLINVDAEQLDQAIEKAKQLKALLQEAKQLIDSLSGN